MKVGAFLEALKKLPLVDPDAFIDGAPFVVLAPHPDDETLGLGGLIAAATASGTDLRIVVLTDGAGSHPASRAYAPPRLALLRRAEVAEAVRHLGVTNNRLEHVDWPDARAPREGAAFEKEARRLADLMATIGARRLFVTWEHDPHCDHETAALLARAVARLRPDIELWAYPIWGLHLDPEREIAAAPPDGVRLAIAPWQPAKSSAISAHASQMTDLIDDDPGGFRFTPQTLAPFLRAEEIVVRMAP